VWWDIGILDVGYWILDIGDIRILGYWDIGH